MTKRIIFAIVISVLFTSCGIIGTGEFARQKYTHYKRGNGSQIIKEKCDYLRSSKETQLTKFTGPSEMTGTGIVPDVKKTDAPILKPLTVNTAKSTTSSKREINRATKPYAFKIHGNSSSNAGDGGCNDVLMILLCIFLPPLAIYLLESTTTRFWIALICFIVGGGFFLTDYVYVGGLVLIAIILAFLAYFGK